MAQWQKSFWMVPVACLALVTCGCQATGPVAEINPFVKSESQPDFQQPVRMAVIWKESAVTTPGKPATRGFGGRVYFYNEENEAIRVDGDLTVYAYDDTHSKGEETRAPERKYVFRAADLQKRHGETGLGDSYNIWLPWDEVGGERKTISLVPIFKPVNGLIPRSDHSIAILSGTTSTEEKDFHRHAGASDSKIRQVSMTVPAGESKNYATQLGAVDSESAGFDPGKTVRTTTFELPRATANRMKLARISNQRKRMADQEQAVEEKSHSAVTVQEAPQPRTVTPAEPEAAPTRSAGKVFGQPGSFR